MPQAQAKLSREQATAKVLKALRKRDQKSTADLAVEIGVHPKALTYVMRDLVSSGRAVSRGTRPTRYTKA